jgi:hypothetical protein
MTGGHRRSGRQIVVKETREVVSRFSSHTRLASPGPGTRDSAAWAPPHRPPAPDDSSEPSYTTSICEGRRVSQRALTVERVQQAASGSSPCGSRSVGDIPGRVLAVAGSQMVLVEMFRAGCCAKRLVARHGRIYREDEDQALEAPGSAPPVERLAASAPRARGI